MVKKYKKLLIAVVVVLCVVVLIVVFGKKTPQIEPTVSGTEVVSEKDGENPKETQGELPTIPEDMTVVVEEPTEFVEPGPGNLNIDEIAGFDQGKEEVLSFNDPDLKLESIGKYSGLFIEDGTDDPIENCLSIVVTNTSTNALQLAYVTLKVNETEEANFMVTNLPAGTSTMVLERDRRVYKESDVYKIDDLSVGFMEGASLMEDTFGITGEDGKLFVKNKSDKSYKKVYVYYKYVQMGGAYLGGITYRVPVENIGAGEMVEVIAGHWREGASRLSMIEIAE